MKVPTWSLKAKNKSVKVQITHEQDIQIQFSIVDGSNENRALCEPLKSIGSKTTLKITQDSALALIQLLTTAINYQHESKN